MIAYWESQKPFPYQIAMLIREKNGKDFTLLYGERNPAKSLMNNIRSNLAFTNGKLNLQPNQQEALRTANAYLQILDPSGREISSFNKPAMGVPTEYTIQELVLQVRYPSRSGLSVATWYDEQSETTWLISIPVDPAVNSDQNPYNFILEPALVVLIVSIIMSLHFACLLVCQPIRFTHAAYAPMVTASGTRTLRGTYRSLWSASQSAS